jgi:hypothetical protein
MTPFLTPSELVDALHRGDPGARESLERLCRDPIARLIGQIIKRYCLRYEGEALLDRTLRWLVLYLRSCDTSDFAGLSGDAFLARIRVVAFKMLSPPELRTGGFGARLLTLAWRLRENLRPDRLTWPIGQPSGRDPYRRSSSIPGAYEYWINTLPREEVGGDWLGVDVEGDKSLWVILADVTGHGYAAYILADGLPYLWRTHGIARLRATGCQPCELLDAIGRELESIIPDDVFVEAGLGRFTTTGEATVSGAGVCRVALRRSGQRMLTLYDFGGPPLGCEWGRRDQRDWVLQSADELTMASDGLFEQPDGDGRQLKESLTRRSVDHLSAGKSLHDAIMVTLSEVLGGRLHRDDITVFTLRLNHEADAG